MSGLWYINGIEQPDPMPCGMPADLNERLAAAEARKREECAARAQVVRDETRSLMREAALVAVGTAVEMRASRFRSNCIYFYGHLDIIRAGLSMESWPVVDRVLSAMIDLEEDRRWQGFGGETRRVNMLAARMVAREKAEAERAQTMEAAE